MKRGRRALRNKPATSVSRRMQFLNAYKPQRLCNALTPNLVYFAAYEIVEVSDMKDTTDFGRVFTSRPFSNVPDSSNGFFAALLTRDNLDLYNNPPNWNVSIMMAGQYSCM